MYKFSFFLADSVDHKIVVRFAVQWMYLPYAGNDFTNKMHGEGMLNHTISLIFISHVFFCSLFKFQEYSEDSNSEPNVDLENQYYNSKALKEDDPKAALSSFQKVNQHLAIYIISFQSHAVKKLTAFSSEL